MKNISQTTVVDENGKLCHLSPKNTLHPIWGVWEGGFVHTVRPETSGTIAWMMKNNDIMIL